MPADPRNVVAVAKRPGVFVKGHDPRRGLTGGRPRTVVEVERILDEEHRTPEKAREVFGRLRSLAMDDVTRVFFDKDGEPHESVEQPNPAFMKLYLERVWGPVKAVDDAQVDKAVRERFEELIAEARARRERSEP